MLIMQKKSDKFSSRYDPSPWLVTAVNGGSEKLKRGNENTVTNLDMSVSCA